MARRIFFKEQSNLGVAPNGYSIMGFNTSNRAIKTDESGVVKLIESVYTDESNTIVIGASGGTGSVSVNGYYELPNYEPLVGQVLGMSGSSLHWITSGGGGLSGAGTTNYLAKWNGSSLTNSVIFDNGTNVGIGTNSPNSRLTVLNSSGGYISGSSNNYIDVVGSIANNDNYPGIRLVGGTLASDYPYWSLTNGGLGSTLYSAQTSNSFSSLSIDQSSINIINKRSGTFYWPLLMKRSNGWLLLNPNNTDSTFVNDALSPLHVMGTTNTSSEYPFRVSDNNYSSFLFGVRADGNVAVGNVSPSARLHVKSNNVSLDYALKVEDFSGSNLFNVRNDGFVSIRNSHYYFGDDGNNILTGSTQYRGINISTHAGTRVNIGRDGGVSVYTNLTVVSNYTPSGTETIGVGTFYGKSSIGVGNIVFAAANSGLGVCAIGVEGGAGGGLSATMRFSLNAPSFGSNINDTNPNNYRIGVGTSSSTDFRMNISDGVKISGGTFSTSTAALDVSSTTQGFLPPRMTTTQRDNISSPAQGLVIFNTTTTKLECYDGTTWQQAW